MPFRALEMLRAFGTFVARERFTALRPIRPCGTGFAGCRGGPLLAGGRSIVAAILEHMYERGGDVGREKTLIEQSPNQRVLALVFSGLERFPQRVVKTVGALFLHFLLGRHPLAADLALREADDVLHLVELAIRHEGDRASAAPSPAGAPDAVDVVVAVVRQVVIEDHLDIV